MTKKLTLKQFLSEDNLEERLKEVTFENGLALLEELVDQVEGGELALEEAVASYERGVQLVTHIRGLLSGVEEKLEVLKVAE